MLHAAAGAGNLALVKYFVTGPDADNRVEVFAETEGAVKTQVATATVTTVLGKSALAEVQQATVQVHDPLRAAPMEINDGDWPTYRACNDRSASSKVLLPSSAVLLWVVLEQEILPLPDLYP